MACAGLPRDITGGDAWRGLFLVYLAWGLLGLGTLGILGDLVPPKTDFSSERSTDPSAVRGHDW